MHLKGFSPCNGDPDVRMDDCTPPYKYICAYINAIILCDKGPQQLADSHINDLNFKLKCVATPTYNLGGDFYFDSDGFLAWGAHSYFR
jgi:hypothetical protein